MARARLPAGPRPVLSRPIDVDKVPDTGLDTIVTASPAECAAIAADAGLPGVENLTARLRIARRGARRFEVTGDLTARITQTCVVTLEPFDSDVTQPIDVTFVETAPPVPERAGRRRREAPVPAPAPRATVTPDDEDPPDPIVDGIIDLGAVVFEFLMLARDLYPRKPGAEFTEVVVGETSDPEPSAFADLQRLKDRP